MNNITLKSEWGYSNTLLLPEEGGGLNWYCFPFGILAVWRFPENLHW